MGNLVAPTNPPAPAEGNPDSTFELTKKASSVELPVSPVAEGDLRETFDLGLMTGAAPEAPPTAGGRQAADATALFEDKPAAPRRKTGAEARANARRCTTCGGVVPRGMSICQTCGLDLDTGMRVGLDDDFAPPPPPPRSAPPIPLLVVGGLSLAVSITLAILALVKWHGGMEGAQYFIPLAGFGIYAAVQFLRGRSVKLLLVALTLGAVIDLAGLVLVPLWKAQADTVVVQRTEASDDPELEDVMIRSPSEELDTDRLSAGLAVLGVYAAVSIYLLSPQVQKHFRR